MTSKAANAALNFWLVLEKMPKRGEEGFFSCHGSEIEAGPKSYKPGQVLCVKNDENPSFLAELVDICGKLIKFKTKDL